MRQLSFASVGFERFGKTTRRAAFLSEMDAVVPWQRLYDLFAPFYPKPGKCRRPVGLDRLLRPGQFVHAQAEAAARIARKNAQAPVKHINRQKVTPSKPSPPRSWQN
jgi:hypothetical protein